MFLDFLKPKPHMILAQMELEAAKRELLKEQTLREYCDGQVTYNQSRIKRLTIYLEQQKDKNV